MPNPFTHVELHTKDPSAAKGSYAKLFSWELDEQPFGEGTYTTINAGDGTGGGILGVPQTETPPHWLAYVAVEDVSAALDKAQSLGGAVIAPRTELPMGAFGVIADPTGAALGLFQHSASDDDAQ